MASKSIAKPVVFVELLPDKTPAISSKSLALHFQKKHKHVLAEIKRIQSITPKSFYEPNFRPTLQTVAMPNNATRQDPAFLLTRDAFSLLAMGFTGKAAILWKLRYIEAFNALEQTALAHVRQKALADGMRLGKRMTPERRALVRKAVRYRSLGLTLAEVAKLIDRKRTCAHDLLRDASLLGLEVLP